MILRRSDGSCSSCSRMYAHTALTIPVRDARGAPMNAAMAGDRFLSAAKPPPPPPAAAVLRFLGLGVGASSSDSASDAESSDLASSSSAGGGWASM